ncbi:MAG: flagellar biosynthesis protein FlhB [Candidatus Eremiobacteraeota bacterium]|nr:flagellar biosynthesis protein FlhB [Candidatus Eremiobacteraeota bacterium]
MAKPEQTERATPKRRSEARTSGRVPRSTEVAPALVFLAAVVILHFGFMYWLNDIYHLVQTSFTHIAAHDALNIYSVWGYFEVGLAPLAPLLTMVFVAALVIGVAANILQVGFLFSLKAIRPNFGKLNPIAGLKNVLISRQTLIQLAKTLIKLFAVAAILYFAVAGALPQIYNSARNSPHDWMVALEALIYTVALRFALFLIAMALLDLVYQRWQFEDSIKMSKAEVKDEQKSAEGSPEAKSAVKNRQRAAARKRMMSAVPKATVVVTNPTHFACALEWDEITMEAPVLTAKGADLMARRIRELAKEHDVPLVENPPLAKTLYYRVELDSPVPPELYAATAQVIAFVYRLKRKTIA